MNPTKRFTDRAADYSVSRPGYGDDALDFILAGTSRPLCVADIGAGTGISARLLAARGCEVLAIEPNAAMRDRAAPHTRVRYIDGTGEATGLPDASIDLLTAFQAFHWFANDGSLAECLRVVRPGGRAALVLNERDERDAFTSAYGSLYRRYALDDTEQRRMRSIDIFKRLPGRAAEREFSHVQTLDRDGFWRRTASSSYMPQTGEAADRLRADTGALFDRFAERQRVHVALRTIVVRIDLEPPAQLSSA
jgi:ubiquinone/menaquinone biosynthesis C-methylase UbiE